MTNKIKSNYERSHKIKTPQSKEELEETKSRVIEIIKLKEKQEKLLKVAIKKQETELKNDKRILLRITKERRFYKKELIKLSARWSSKISANRKWVLMHPIEALNTFSEKEIIQSRLNDNER